MTTKTLASVRIFAALAALAAVLLIPSSASAAYGWLGVGVGEITADRVSALKLKEERGVEILDVKANSPASQAGLKEHDVVLEFNGVRVEGVEQFQRMVRETPADRAVKLLIVRDGSAQTISAKLANRPDFLWEGGTAMARPRVQVNPRIQVDPPSFRFHMPEIDIPDMGEMIVWATNSRLGIDGETLTKQLGEFFGVPSGEGVLVRAVEKDSAAEKAGIKAGDVIVKMDGERVASMKDLRELVRNRLGKTGVPVALIRNKRETSVAVTIERRDPVGRKIIERAVVPQRL